MKETDRDGFCALSENFKQDGEPLLRFEAEYPCGSGSPQADRYFKASTQAFYGFAKKKAVKKAREAYVAALRRSARFEPFVIRQSCECYKNESFISCLMNRYHFFGGVHGYTTLYADTFELKTGRMLAMSDIFCTNPQKSIIEEISKQISQRVELGNNYFYDNWKKGIKKYYTVEQFAITENGLCIFYQEYQLAPFSCGAPRFIVVWDKLPALRQPLLQK